MNSDNTKYKDFRKAIEDQAKFTMPLGIFVTTISLIKMETPSDYMMIAVGLGWILTSLLSKYLKSAYVFLVSAVTSAILCCLFILDFRNSGGESYFDLFIAFIIGTTVFSSIKQFAKYKNIEPDPDYVHPPKKPAGYIWKFCKFIVLILLILGVIFTIYAPPSGVLNMASLEEEHLDFFYESKFCDKQKEDIIYVIFDGIIGFKESGIILTSKKVVLYKEGDNIDSALVFSLGEIDTVVAGEEDWGTRECIVNLKNMTTVTIRVPATEKNEDQKFIRKLQELSAKSKQDKKPG